MIAATATANAQGDPTAAAVTVENLRNTSRRRFPLEESAGALRCCVTALSDVLPVGTPEVGRVGFISAFSAPRGRLTGNLRAAVSLLIEEAMRTACHGSNVRPGFAPFSRLCCA